MTNGILSSQHIIDVHCHNILPEFRNLLETHGAALEETFPLPDWSEDNHLKFMKETGISQSVLSMPAPQPWFGDKEECIKAIRSYNEYCARLKNKYPDKFKFCASLPLPDIDASIKEIIYALDTLGADGIKLATNSRALYVGDAKLDTLMKVLNEYEAVVILHPHKPTPVNEGIIETSPLAIYEYPAETTRAVINMISRNIPSRYPKIKIVVPHCGAFLPLAIPRMKTVHPIMMLNGIMGNIDWEENLKHLYYDLAGAATPEVLNALLTITTPEHLLYGSDYPYQSGEVLKSNLTNMKKWMSNDKIFSSILPLILYKNAEKLFNRSM